VSRTLQAVDVAVVGFGPVGQLAANRLGGLGLRVACLERSPEPHGTPRAAVIDDGCQRILQRAGLTTPLEPVLHLSGPVATVDAGGRERRVLDPAVRRDGHPQLVSFDQRELEDVLAAGVRRFAGVQVMLGCTVERLEQDTAGVTLHARDAGGPLSVRAGWVLACDGARSTVRRLCGVTYSGSTFSQPWLVVDAEVAAPVAGVPGVRFVTDPRRPAVTLPLTPRLHRWEFMLGAGEQPDWQTLVARWTDPAGLRVRRVAVYTYHARMASAWRSGRVLLAGDAAHVMPPFAGQGLGAGLRDADNAAWKLAAVVRDGAGPALLDTVESERRPDVARYTALARLMGAVVQTRRARAARARDAAEGAIRSLPAADAFLSRGGGRPASRLGPGCRLRTPGAGRPLPQPRVSTGDGDVLLDDVLPPGWTVVTRGDVPQARGLGLPVVRLGVDVADLEGTLDPWLARRRASLAVVRPDRHVFAAGGASVVARARGMLDEVLG
jgi:3-(3-hydroxy-phenyl)propionate hydroxylase